MPINRDRSEELQDQRLAQMAASALDRKATCTEAEAMRWVAARLVVPLEKIPLADVPSPTAVSLLKWARTPGGLTEFMREWARKLIPSAEKMEHYDRMSDDGSSVLEAIAEFEAFRKVPDDDDRRMHQA